MNFRKFQYHWFPTTPRLLEHPFGTQLTVTMPRGTVLTGRARVQRDASTSWDRFAVSFQALALIGNEPVKFECRLFVLLSERSCEEFYVPTGKVLVHIGSFADPQSPFVEWDVFEVVDSN